jgi:hypothetical protein
MRKSIVILVLLVFALMSVTAITVAQDGADEHNPCLNGTWHCPDPNNPAQEEWNWAAGWYWALYYAGEITYPQIPEWIRGPLYPDGYCQVDLAARGFTSVDRIHVQVGYDIWDPANFVEWVPSSAGLPACSFLG